MMLSAKTTPNFRTAQPDDCGRLAEVFAASWRSAYHDIIPPKQLREIIKKHDAKWWRRSVNGRNATLVLEVAGKIGGYATYGPSRNTRSVVGEIYELYLAPEYQGLGLGSDLFEATRARLDLQWCGGLMVWVLSENWRSILFYESLGGEQSATQQFRFAGLPLERTLMAWNAT